MLKEDMRDAVAIAKGLWFTIRSNQAFVIVSGAFFGAAGDTIFDGIQNGHLDFSHSGIHRILASSAGTAFIAWWHLNRPAPGATANK